MDPFVSAGGTTGDDVSSQLGHTPDPRALHRVFNVKEIGDNILIRLTNRQLRTAHGLRNVSEDFRSNVYNAPTVQQHLFAEPVSSCADNWIVDMKRGEIRHIAPESFPLPVPMPHVRSRKPHIANPFIFGENNGQPILPNARYPFPGESSLYIKTDLLNVDENLAALQAQITKPSARDATIYDRARTFHIYNGLGILVNDLRNKIKEIDPAGSQGWTLRIPGAVFTTDAIMKKVRREGSLRLGTGIGELLDDSTTAPLRGHDRRPTYSDPSFQARKLAIRNQILHYLPPPDLFRLEQTSRGVHDALGLFAFRENAFCDARFQPQAWIIKLDPGNESVWVRFDAGLLDNVKLKEDIIATIDALNDRGRRLVLKRVYVYNEAAFFPPVPALEQVTSPTVGLKFSVVKNTISNTSTLREILPTDPPVIAVVVVGRNASDKKTRSIVSKPDGLSMHEIVEASHKVDTVHVADGLLLSMKEWERMQDVPEVDAASLNGWYVSSMEEEIDIHNKRRLALEGAKLRAWIQENNAALEAEEDLHL